MLHQCPFFAELRSKRPTAQGQFCDLTSANPFILGNTDPTGPPLAYARNLPDPVSAGGFCGKYPVSIKLGARKVAIAAEMEFGGQLPIWSAERLIRRIVSLMHAPAALRTPREQIRSGGR